MSDSAASTPNNKRRDHASLELVGKRLFCGGVAGAVAKTVTAPLERVKIIIQVRTQNQHQHQHHQHHIQSTAAAESTHQPIRVFHLLNSIFKREGVYGLFRGNSATLLRVFPYAAIQFASFESYKILFSDGVASLLSRRQMFLDREFKTDDFANFVVFLSGALAGGTAVLATYPLDLVRARFAVLISPRFSTSTTTSAVDPQLRHNLRSIFRRIWIEEERRISGFFRGIKPTLLGILPYAGLNFLSFDYLKKSMLRYDKNRFESARLGQATESPFLLFCKQKSSNSRSSSSELAPTTSEADIELRQFSKLLAGGLAGAIGQTVTYPLDVIRRRQQIAPSFIAPSFIPDADMPRLDSQSDSSRASHKQRMSDIHRRGIFELLLKIIKEEGFKGLFKGVSINYIKVTPMVGTSFFVYENMKKWMEI